MALETLDSASGSKTAGASPAVRIRDLRKSFDGRLVLGGIDLDVPVGRIVSITSAMVASPHPSQAPSAGARTALWAVMKGLSKTVAIDNVTINQLLPQRIDSPRQIEVARAYMKEANITFEEARRMQAEDMPTGRMGLPSEFAAACAFLCSTHAAYISGTSLRLDGGDYRGLI